jgi:WD40 repeat protein
LVLSLFFFFLICFLLLLFRPVTSIKWLPIDQNDCYHHPAFTANKLIACTEDGNLLCLDCNGKLFAACSLDNSSSSRPLSPAPPSSSSSSVPAILSLDTDGRLIIGGCSDASIRIWIMSNGTMQQIQCYSKAHSGGITAICFGKAIEDLSLGNVSGKDSNSSSNTGTSSDSELFVSGSDDCSIRIWRIWYG